MTGREEYPVLVEELEEAFRQERDAIEALDEEKVSELLERIDGLLLRLVEASRLVTPEVALATLERVDRLRRGNAVLLRDRLEEMRDDLSGVRRGRRAAVAYRPLTGERRGLAVDREA